MQAEAQARASIAPPSSLSEALNDRGVGAAQAATAQAGLPAPAAADARSRLAPLLPRSNIAETVTAVAIRLLLLLLLLCVASTSRRP
ncbi:hypothetical protein GLA29479_2440 [Lysobacter antibioticus]|nr:hypothetical protein GLA29479_2440 [Lysobacter antibioticus]